MANRKVVGVRRNVRIRTDLTTENELRQMAKREGVKVTFYSGAGDEGGHAGSGIISMNRNKFKEQTDFYLRGVEITMENKHIIQMPTSKAIFFHEKAHLMFSKNADFGHKILNALKKLHVEGEYGHPTAYAAITNEFEGMMEFYAFFRLKPAKLRVTQPKVYKLMRQWHQAVG